MSTSCITEFYDAHRPEVVVARVYRHSDGYPDGAGSDILAFLERTGKLGDSRHDDPSYLAARYVVFLAEMFAKTFNDKFEYVPAEDRLDFISCGIVPAEAKWQVEYTYHIICGAERHAPPEVKCFDSEGSEIEIPPPKEA